MSKKGFDKDPDPETAELEFLAKSTPTKFAIMKIKDVRSGLEIDVDQSLDSTFGGRSEDIKLFLQEFLDLYVYFKNEKYKGQFNGLHKVQINNLVIDFGSYEGEKAYNWLKRYVNVVVDLMHREKVIDLEGFEREVNGRYEKGRTLEQSIQEQNT